MKNFCYLELKCWWSLNQRIFLLRYIIQNNSLIPGSCSVQHFELTALWICMRQFWYPEMTILRIPANILATGNNHILDPRETQISSVFMKFLFLLAFYLELWLQTLMDIGYKQNMWNFSQSGSALYPSSVSVWPTEHQPAGRGGGAWPG